MSGPTELVSGGSFQRDQIIGMIGLRSPLSQEEIYSQRESVMAVVVTTMAVLSMDNMEVTMADVMLEMISTLRVPQHRNSFIFLHRTGLTGFRIM